MSHYKQLPDGRWQTEEAIPQFVRAYYMRDNHTFRPLPMELKGAMQALRYERDGFYTHGMLCGHPIGVAPEPVHARGLEHWEAFEKEARNWLRKAIAKSKPPGKQKP